MTLHRLAYDEVCVLLDCLNLAKAEKLMELMGPKEPERRLMVSSSDEKLVEVSDKTLSLVLKRKVRKNSGNFKCLWVIHDRKHTYF